VHQLNSMKHIRSIAILVLLYPFVLLSQAQESEALRDVLYKTYHENEDSITYYFNQARKMLNSPEDTVMYYFFKCIYFSSDRDFDSTMHYAHAVIEHPVGKNDAYKKLYMYRNASRRLQDKGRYEDAHEYMLKGMDEAVIMADTNEIAYQLLEISNNYHDFEAYAKGVDYGKRSYKMLANYANANPYYKCYALNCIAINFDDWNMPDSALFYHYKVLDMLATGSVDSSRVQFTFNNIANTLLKSERFGEALPFIRTSLKLNKRRGDNYNLTTNYTNLATIEYKLGRMKAAEKYFDSAHYHANKAQNVEKWRDLYFQNYQFEKTRGNYRYALDLQEKYVELRDSIFNMGRAALIGELETKYQTARKDQQLAEQEAELIARRAALQRNIYLTTLLVFIALSLLIILILLRGRYRKKQSLLEQEKTLAIRETQINAAIESQEAERKRFAQDLHDGFGQLISGLRLFMSQIESENNRDSRQALFHKSERVLEEMHKEIRNIAFNLMPATLIQSGLDAALKEFAQRFNQSGKVVLQTDTFDLQERLPELLEISIYRIVQEWVNNIIKYANATRIDVQLVRHDTELVLMIEDDGEGFDTSTLYQSQGHGWRNIQSRVNRIHAALHIDSNKGRQGSLLEITIPLQQSIRATTTEGESTTISA
jgi:two-component system, NarL family, sensor kinase